MGLTSRFARFIEKIRAYGEKIAMVGDGYRRHLLAGSFVEKLAGLARAVQKAVVGVDVEMNKLRIAHGS